MPDGPDVGVAQRLGDLLRNIREQQRLSLQDVERRSEGELKASVVGAYERGERSVSITRLQRLARFYGVPLARLLPNLAGPRHDGAREKFHVRIVLDELEQRTEPDLRLVFRYVRSLQERRGDYNGRVITIRESDVDAIAAVLAVESSALEARLLAEGVAVLV